MNKQDLSNEEIEDFNSAEEKMVLRSATNSSKPRKTWREDGFDDDYEFEESDDADIDYTSSRKSRAKVFSSFSFNRKFLTVQIRPDFPLGNQSSQTRAKTSKRNGKTSVAVSSMSFAF
jgi:hypothetical protein